MALDSFEKQPYEEFRISADFGLNFQAGETLTQANCSVEAKDPEDQDWTVTVTDQATVAVIDGVESGISQSALQVLVRGGEHGKTYKITFKGETSLDHHWELDVNMKVKEL
jgi:hypothetical protein